MHHTDNQWICMYYSSSHNSELMHSQDLLMGVIERYAINWGTCIPHTRSKALRGGVGGHHPWGNIPGNLSKLYTKCVHFKYFDAL